ncbi:MAG: hypothetical protein WB555_10565 [Candidatus Korobacteraceae bacterium]
MLSLSFVLGMAVAIAVYAAWRSGVIPPSFPNFLSALSLFVCPPFVLSFAVGPAPDSGLALSLIVGTIVFANAFLYAGVAAGGYFVVSIMMKNKRRS